MTDLPSMIRCADCNGEGMVDEAFARSTLDDQPYYRRRTCIECQGTGEVEPDWSPAQRIYVADMLEMVALLKREILNVRELRRADLARIRSMHEQIDALAEQMRKDDR